MRRSLMTTDHVWTASGIAAVVFLVALAARWVAYLLVRVRAPHVPTYQRLTDLIAVYELVSWALLAVAVAATTMAVLSLAVKVAGLSVPERARVWVSRWAFAGAGFGVYVCWLAWQSIDDAAPGLSVMRPAGARPQPEEVSVTVAHAQDWPYPMVGAFGLLLAAVWAWTHVRLVRVLTSG